MNSLVTIIITTKNEASVIEDLLKSIKLQSYKKSEIILVDNNSSDLTKEIARKYTRFVFNKGPERSAQRNFGAQKAKGKYLFFLDADMVLTKNVISSCVESIQKSDAGGVIVSEESFGEGFWANVKAYERSFYVGDDSIEAARFYSKQIFNDVGGFDEQINGPEDWDMSERVCEKYGLARATAVIRHNEGYLSLFDLLKKKAYYAAKSHRYMEKGKKKLYSPQSFFFFRKAFYTHPEKIIAHPLLFISMITMITAELCAGAYGYFFMKR